MPASTQHSISTWRAGWAADALGRLCGLPTHQGAGSSRVEAPLMSVLGRSARLLAPAQGPPSGGLTHFSTPSRPETGSEPRPSCATSCLARVDVGAGTADPVLSSPPQIRSHAWSGPVLPSRTEPPPPPRERRAASTGQAGEDLTSPISRPRARARSRGRQARGKGSHATVVTDFLYKHPEGSPLKCPLRGWAWSGLAPSQDQGCTWRGRGALRSRRGPGLSFPRSMGRSGRGPRCLP